ncbi:hypothetical protein FOFC_17969 [Fusarium oxysporum]|nr:hypothetical protein FOFC_17969 [Fusarium oxysporum]
MKLSTIAFLLASLLAFLLGLFALENVAAGLERNESTTAIAAFDFVNMMSMLGTEDTFEDIASHVAPTFNYYALDAALLSLRLCS